MPEIEKADYLPSLAGLNLQHAQFANFVEANNMTAIRPLNFTFSEWLFTSKPGVFGLFPGWAMPTGAGIVVVMIIMGLGALPWIRRKGHFEVCTFGHLIKHNLGNFGILTDLLLDAHILHRVLVPPGAPLCRLLDLVPASGPAVPSWQGIHGSQVVLRNGQDPRRQRCPPSIKGHPTHS